MAIKFLNNQEITGDLSVGSNTNGYDVTFFGDASGEFMQWDASAAALTISHTDEEAGLGIFTNGSAQTTQPQFKVGRNTSEYWGVYTDDRNAHLVHRQDESTGIMTTRFDQWDNNTGDDTGLWLWRSGDASGASMVTALTLTQAGSATFGTYSGGGGGELNLRDNTTASTVNKSIYVSAQNSGRASIFLDTTAQAGVSQIGFGPTQYAAQNTSGSIEYTNSSSTLVIKTNYQPAITIDSNRWLGIGTTSPGARLDIVGSGLSTTFRLSNTEANATTKYGAIVGRHYTNAEQNVTGMLITSSSSITGGSVSIGGGISTTNAVNKIQFYTALNNTTLTGTERMRITQAGNVGIGTTNPQAQLNVVAGSTVRTWTPASGTSAIFESSNSSRAFVSIVGANQSELLFGDAGSQFSGRVRYNHSDNKLSLWANGNQHVTVDNTGNVGIGTDNPGAKLEVYGSSPNILINNTAETDSGIVFTDAQAGTTQRAAIKFNSSDQKLKFFVNDEVAQRMVIDTAGNVGIGATNPSYQLQLSTNSAAKPSSSTWTVVSDERVKENIKPYEKGLNEILQVNTKTFDYNGKAGFDKIKDNVGIIAQDMIKIFPETIKTYNAKLNETDEEETELYNFDGHALTFALINAVKELKAEIEELKKQINK